MNHFIAVAVFGLLIAGCATVGSEFDIAAVDKLQPGISTVQDAVALLGPYSTQSTNSKGMHAYGWTYGKTNGFIGKMESRAVMLVFGPDGKLERKGSSQNDGRF